MRLGTFHCWLLAAALGFAGAPAATSAQSDSPITLKATDAYDRSFTHVSLGKASMRNVTGILQDAQGFLWFAGQDRLQRYDGNEVRDYRGVAAQPNSPASFTRSMAVGREGKLWLARDRGAGLTGPFGSLDEFDPVTDALQPYVSGKHPFTGPIIHVLQDRFGTLWLSTSQGLYGMDPHTRRIVRYGGLSADDVRATLETKDGTFWVATTRGIDLFDRATGHVLEHYSFPGDYSMTVPFNAAISICEDSGGNIWAASPDGLGRVDRKSGKLIRYHLEIDDPGHRYTTANDVHADRSGALWVATGSGLLMLNAERTRLLRYRNDPANLESLSGNNVLSIYEDRENNMWVGTDDGGLDVFPEKPPPFKRYRHEPGNENSLDGNEIRSIIEDSRGIVWAATLRSLDSLNRRKGVITHYRQTGGPSRLSGTVILSSAEDRAGYLWFGTLGHGLNRLDPRTGSFRTWFHDKSDPHSLSDDSVTKLLIDSTGRLVVGTLAGVDVFDGSTFQHLARVRVWDIAEDAKGILWIASRASGLLRLDPATGEQKTYRASSASGSLSDDQTTGLCIDHTGTLWVGTLHGLNRLDAASGKFKTYYEEDGLSNNAVSRILEDETGNLWVSTGYGISRLNPRTGTFTNYDATDGIAGNEFYGYAPAWKSPSGEMFFASHSGLTAFFPKEVVANPYPPPVLITNLRVPLRSLDFGSRSRAGAGHRPLRAGMRLPPLTGDLQIGYTALSFVAPEKIRFKYVLEGYDRDWQDAGNRRQAFYTNLPPRNYRFRVIASNNNGVWNETGDTLEFSIAPAYWQTNWFLTLLVATLLAVIWAAYQFRVWRVQQESKRLRDVIETIPAYVWSAEPDGSVDFVNGRWLNFTGFSPDQALRWGWFDAVHPDDRPRLQQAWRAAIASGKPFEAEARLRGADGQYRWILIEGVPLRDGSGKTVKWYGKSTDIEDRERLRQLEADLAHTNRVGMLGELAASIAHEVNQPLAGIVSNGSAGLRWLSGDSPDVDEVREALRDIVRDGKRAGEVIARIRALTKRVAPPKEKLDLNETVREVLALVADEAKRKRVVIRTQFADDLAAVSGDRVQLQQVLLNLLMNAMDAMSSVEDRTRELAIATQNIDPDRVQVTVEDSGIGLDPNTMARIFEPFYTTKSSGMGMGLSISRSIVQNHGGRLWATANDGPGTRFHFTLPKSEEQHAARTA